MTKKRGKGPIRGRKGPAKPVDALLIAAITPDMHVDPCAIDVDGTRCAVINYVDYETENDIGWLDVVLNQPNMPLCIRLEPETAVHLRDGIDMNERHVKNSLADSRMSASKEDMLMREATHGRRMLQMLGDSNAKFFEVAISSVLRTGGEEAMTRDLNYYKTLVESAGMRLLVKQYNQMQAFMAASPAMTRDRDGWESSCFPMPASTIGHTLFTREPGLADPVGIQMGHDNLGGTVRLDIVSRAPSRHNSNIVIFGSAGSGKSATAKKLALHEYLIWGSRVIVIDPEGEWVDIGRRLGEVIKVGAKSSAKISPLEPRALTYDEESDTGEADIDDDDDATRQLVLLSTIPFAKAFMQLAFDIPAEEMDSLEIALERAYGRYGIGQTTDFHEYRTKGLSYPIMTDVYEELMELKGEEPEHAGVYDRLARRLRSAAVGINSPLWNSRTTIESNSDFLVINTEDMSASESMKAATYFNLLSFVWSNVRMAPKTGKPIRVILDEGHTAVNPRSVASADMVKSIVKRIRKRGGGTTFITQEVNDLLNQDIRAQGAAICNNATYKFLGQAEGDNARAMAELYGMPPELVERVKKADKGNFALYAGTLDRTWLKVDLAEWEKGLFGDKGGK